MSGAETRRALILVVDDEPVVMRLIADALAIDRHEVDTVANGLEPQDRIAARSYDIVSDVRMPELDGVALYRELEKRDPDLLRRIAFVTGTTELPEYASFLDETAIPVLHKPFNLGDLQRFIRQLL
jgi:two-component system NtrC family sensor kinase